MRTVAIKALPNGAHLHTRDVPCVPKGHAVIPEDMVLENFPFGRVEAKEIDGVLTVTKWTPIKPKPMPIENTTPSEQDDTDAMLVDHEYRLTLLELGV